jgi:hypothetical protein
LEVVGLASIVLFASTASPFGWFVGAVGSWASAGRSGWRRNRKSLPSSSPAVSRLPGVRGHLVEVSVLGRGVGRVRVTTLVARPRQVGRPHQRHTRLPPRRSLPSPTLAQALPSLSFCEANCRTASADQSPRPGSNGRLAYPRQGDPSVGESIETTSAQDSDPR